MPPGGDPGGPPKRVQHGGENAIDSAIAAVQIALDDPIVADVSKEQLHLAMGHLLTAERLDA